MKRAITLLCTAVMLLAAPAAAAQPAPSSGQAATQTLVDVDGEGEGEFTNETSASLAADLANSDVATADPNDPITRVNAAIYLGTIARRVRDYSSLIAMVKYYSRTCYDDIGTLNPDNNYVRARTICFLKNKGVFTNSYSEGINPYSGFDRGLAAVYHARLGRYLGPLPSANGSWFNPSHAGCEIFVDVKCGTAVSDATAELVYNGVTSGCGDPSDDKFCPGIRFTWGHAGSWMENMVDDLD
jgi:hypothetical protein